VRWSLLGSATFVIDTSISVAVFHLTHVGISSNILSAIITTTFNFSSYYWSFASYCNHRQSTILYLTFIIFILFLGTIILNFLINQGTCRYLQKWNCCIYCLRWMSNFELIPNPYQPNIWRWFLADFLSKTGCCTLTTAVK